MSVDFPDPGPPNEEFARPASRERLELVVGHQKLVRDIPEGLRRIREYCLPREFVRVQAIGYPGTRHGKTLILHTELGDRIRVILVPETLGF